MFWYFLSYKLFSSFETNVFCSFLALTLMFLKTENFSELEILSNFFFQNELPRVIVTEEMIDEENENASQITDTVFVDTTQTKPSIDATSEVSSESPTQEGEDEEGIF